MSGTKFKFTTPKIRGLQPDSKKRRYLYDEQLPGLGLTVTPKGTKSFFLQVGRDKAKRRIALTDAASSRPSSRFPDITVEIARQRAANMLSKIERGTDPIQEKRGNTDPDELTVQQAFDEYKAEKPSLRESTIKAYEDAMNPVLGDWMDRKLFSITPKEVLNCHNGYGSKSQAKHAMRALRAVYNHHIRINQLDKANPVAIAFAGDGKDAPKLNFKKRRKTLIEDGSLAEWFDAVEALPDAGERSTWRGDVARDLFLFQLFTGLRSKSECASLEWDQVDLRKKTVTYEETKTTDKDDDDVVIPLNSEAIKILRKRPKGRHVFQVGDRWLDDVRSYIEKVRAVTGSNWTPYDSRRTFLSQGEAAEVPMLTLKRLVNHATAEHDVTAGYITPSLEDMRKQSERIALRILKKAKRSKQAFGKVVALRDMACT
ncbi:MAG: integrase family protein [Gammaproteobacteria bacterium]|nr:integrase family protein [Gammaproteobacteria bacterium]